MAGVKRGFSTPRIVKPPSPEGTIFPPISQTMPSRSPLGPVISVPNVGPDVNHVHTTLIKLGHPLDTPFYRPRGYVQPRRRVRIAQEVEAPVILSRKYPTKACKCKNQRPAKNPSFYRMKSS